MEHLGDVLGGLIVPACERAEARAAAVYSQRGGEREECDDTGQEFGEMHS